MSSFTSDLSQKCPRCARPVPAGALECSQCNTLVRGDEVEQLAAHARTLEAHGDFQQARERWLASLPLLPSQSPHAAWIRKHIEELERGIPAGQTGQPGQPKSRWVERLGPLGPALLALWKFKSLFSFVAFFGFYWQAWGAKFGIGFALLVLIHEMGHFIDIKRRGLPADMPVFLPGLGAYVRWNALGVSLEARAAISLAGPLAGWLAAAVCAGLWFQTGYGLWSALARTSAWFNALNLIPLWIFDGSTAMLPLSKVGRAVVLLVSAALGYVVGEWVFGLVAIGTGVRLFTHDTPPEGSTSTASYFIAVLAALALV
ncbi:MAG TPA: site-2 protease family protein, partial [Candidatus Sulfotelmatobacter sp.]|nr:site-2 protease family protein [Candidatus Sulfotelmatobacter sp.]